MKKLTTIILLSVTVLATAATLGFAAGDSATVTVNFSVNAQQSLRIKSNSTNKSDTVESVFNIPSPNDQDLKKGEVIKEDALELVATSNIKWAVNVKARNSSLGTGREGYRKPVSDLSVRGQGVFKQVSTSPVTIASGQPGEHEIGVDYKVDYDEDYKPGNYKAELVFNISTA